MTNHFSKPAGRALALSGCASAMLSLQLLAGCASNGEPQQFVSRPNMQFSKSAVYSYTSKIMPQIQPGLAQSGGAQATVCTLCR